MRSSRSKRVHTQVIGDDFRAMHSTSTVSAGITQLSETEELDTSPVIESVGQIYCGCHVNSRQKMSLLKVETATR